MAKLNTILVFCSHKADRLLQEPREGTKGSGMRDISFVIQHLPFLLVLILILCRVTYGRKLIMKGRP